jgi:4-hydroxybenzoate polyprenyltransferase
MLGRVSDVHAGQQRAGDFALRDLVSALRPQQWIKNLLLWVPLLLAHDGASSRVLAVLCGFAAFCFAASAGYVVNDLLDREADRAHPTKRKRPFASGALSPRQGVALLVALLVAALALSLGAVGPAFTGMVVLYLVLTLSYSFYFKEMLFLDVLLLAGLYCLRVLSGAVAADVTASPWLLAFSLFFFLSLAFVKRYTEIRRHAEPGALPRRNYRSDDLGLIQTLGPTTAYLSVLVLALYITSRDVTRLYATPQLLWLVCPILLYWITRIWFLAGRNELPDDPVLFAARDLQSYAAGVLIALCGFLATLSL